MPSRLVSLAILIYWSIAAFFLLTWEVLPELTLGYPPDLRAIASAAGTNPGPVTWSIDVIDDRAKPGRGGPSVSRRPRPRGPRTRPMS